VNGRKAKDNSASAKVNAAEAAKALGPANGTTVLELLHRLDATLDEIKAFEDYQHGRNHDLLTVLSRIDGSTALLLKVIEKLLAHLDTEENT
jgi:hypothetical protein